MIKKKKKKRNVDKYVKHDSRSRDHKRTKLPFPLAQRDTSAQRRRVSVRYWPIARLNREQRDVFDLTEVD